MDVSFDPVNTALRFVALAAIFLFQTYLFRGRVAVEGFSGYFLLLFLLVPANVLGGPMAVLVARPEFEEFFLQLAVLFIFNLIVFTLWRRFLPGFTTTGWLTMGVFAFLFTSAAIALRLAPPIPFANLFQGS
jgi:hypothetical protein